MFVTQDCQEAGCDEDVCTSDVIPTPKTKQRSHCQVVHLGGGGGRGEGGGRGGQDMRLAKASSHYCYCTSDTCMRA